MELKYGFTLQGVVDAGKERKATFSVKDYEPDIEGLVEYSKEKKESRETPCTSGYRPAHQVTENYLTTGEHIYIDKEVVWPGEKAKAYIKFVSPEVYPHSLWVGKLLNINEGDFVVGTVTVLKIYNEILKKANKPIKDDLPKQDFF